MATHIGSQQKDRNMRIAQIAPLTESIPPKLYGGTERVVAWLTDELVSLGHEVVLFASGDSRTSAMLEACWPRSLRLDGTVRDANALHISMLERVRLTSSSLATEGFVRFKMLRISFFIARRICWNSFA